MTSFDSFLATELDQDQVNDIAHYGMSGGVSGFIYHNELNELFDKYEEDIMGYLDDIDLTLGEFAQETKSADFNQLRCNLVWAYVEQYACYVMDSKVAA